MSLAARCPWCETVFRLTKEQAAVRAGLARCGVCNHTFNSLDYLVRTSDLGLVAERRGGFPRSTFNDDPAQAGRDIDQSLDDDSSKAPAALTEPAPEAGPERTEPRLSTRPENEALLEDPTHTEPALEEAAPADETVTIGERRLSEPSFLRSARGDDVRPRSRMVTTLWGLLAFIALLALLGQTAFFWRSELVTLAPPLRTPFEKACVALHCRIEPPADIAMISIESSGLEAVPGRKDAMTFNALLHNRSSAPGRYPAIDLTLTDAQDHAMIRRVLQSGEYLSSADQARVPLGLAPNSELPVKIVFEVPGGGVAGYRVAVFYP